MAKEKEKRGGCFKTILAVLLFIVLGVAVLIGVNIQKLKADHYDLKISGDYDDFLSGMEKVKTDIVGDVSRLHPLNIYNGDYETDGSIPVEATLSVEEIYAILNEANKESGPLKNIQIKLAQGNRFEFYCMTNKSIMTVMNKHLGLTEEENPVLVKWIGKILHNKPVYGKGSFELVSSNYVEIRLETVRLGNRVLKEEAVRIIEGELRNLINKTASKENGIEIEELSVKNGALVFKGTLPAEIKGR